MWVQAIAGVGFADIACIRELCRSKLLPRAKQGLSTLSQWLSCLLRQLYALIVDPASCCEASGKLVSPFISVNRQPRLQGLADFVMKSLFWPLEPTHLHSFVSVPFVNGRL